MDSSLYSKLRQDESDDHPEAHVFPQALCARPTESRQWAYAIGIALCLAVVTTCVAVMAGYAASKAFLWGHASSEQPSPLPEAFFPSCESGSIDKHGLLLMWISWQGASSLR